jgi:hypothetical protein
MKDGRWSRQHYTSKENSSKRSNIVKKVYKKEEEKTYCDKYRHIY